MIFHVFSAIGRTGSWRVCKLLSNSYREHTMKFQNSFTDPADEHFCHHVHTLSTELLPDAIPILSTRAVRKDAALSSIIAEKTNQWRPENQKANLSPFTVDEGYYNYKVFKMIQQEKEFIKRFNPIVIYLEDTVETVEAKISNALEIEFKCPYPESDKIFISKYPPKDYIINYSKLPHWRPSQIPRNFESSLPYEQQEIVLKR